MTALGAAAVLLVCGVGGGVVVAHRLAPRPSTEITAAPVLTVPTATEAARASSLPDVAARVTPSVVQVDVVAGRQSGQGSGVLLTADGMVLTNNHVIANGVTAGPQALRVVLADGTALTASIVGRAPAADLAVLKVAATGLPAVELGSSATLAVGQVVVAVGSPLGLAGTVSSGIVSAVDRPVRIDIPAAGTGASGATVLDAVQTDATVDPGSSGGALVNLAGQLVGVSTAPGSATGGADTTAGFAGVGYAIPVDEVARVAEALIDGGTAQEAVLGVALAPPGPTGYAAAGGGVTVAEVTPGGPAARAGIEPGAVLSRLDDRVLDDVDAVAAALRAHAPGDVVTVTAQAPGGARADTRSVTLGGRPM